MLASQVNKGCTDPLQSQEKFRNGLAKSFFPFGYKGSAC